MACIRSLPETSGPCPHYEDAALPRDDRLVLGASKLGVQLCLSRHIAGELEQRHAAADAGVVVKLTRDARLFLFGGDK